MESEFVFMPSVGGYNVFLEGLPIGEVWKNERRYNLRRLIVIRGWSARPARGTTLGKHEPQIFPTRKKAAQALVSAASPREAREGEGNAD